MAIKEQKIYTSDYSDKDVSGLPDSVVGQADWLKARFDALTKEVVVPRFNAVIDELAGEQGAGNIGTGWKHGTLGTAVVSACHGCPDRCARTSAVSSRSGTNASV